MTFYLKTRDVADFLGFQTTTAVVRLIESGALPCARKRITVSKGKERIVYRPTVEEVREYLSVYDKALVNDWDVSCVRNEWIVPGALEKIAS